MGRETELVKSFGPDSISYLVEHDPTIFSKTMLYANSMFWREVNSEINFILSNNIRELLDVLPGCELMGHKWIFKKKIKDDSL